MKRLLKGFLAGALAFLPLSAAAQTAPPVDQTVKAADDRFKADILVVVAHPDDEAAVTPYLARAIYDEHKRVAVVYGTRGGSGSNEYRRESGPALAEVREQEARQACAALGITNVWFLDGKDTASQNVLTSLASWGHGKNLEEMVRLVRLTRPEVIITWLPAVFIGENHGDHQAAGVLATEAFDLANDPTAFPSQVAGASKRLEPYLESLAPWQPKKIYYFSDANDQKQFAATGPAYSVKEISPSQKKPYWRFAIDAAKPHLTQFPNDIQQLSKLSDAQLEQLMNDPNKAWWSDPMTLIFGKSVVRCAPKEDVFACFDSHEAPFSTINNSLRLVPKDPNAPGVTLAGPWGYYERFRAAHNLPNLPLSRLPEIGVKTGSTLSIPLMLTRTKDSSIEIELKATVPEGWRVSSGAGKLLLPAEPSTPLRLEIDTPALSADELKKSQPVEITVTAYEKGKTFGEIKLRVKLQSTGLPQN